MIIFKKENRNKMAKPGSECNLYDSQVHAPNHYIPKETDPGYPNDKYLEKQFNKRSQVSLQFCF